MARRSDTGDGGPEKDGRRYPPRESLYLCTAKKCFATVTEPWKVAAEVRKYMEGLKEEK